MQGFDFLHQGFVYRQATGGIHQQHIYIVLAGVIQGGQHNVDRLLTGVTWEPLGTGLRCHSFKLLNRSWAVNVRRHRQHFLFALEDQVLGEFGGGGGFTGTLQTCHQDHCGGLCRQIDIGNAFAHGGGQFFLHDAHQHLPWGE